MEYPYISLSYVARLEFRDAHGLDAIFHCYQRLRVLVPELFVVSHRIWGGGDQFAAFASPGADPVQLVDGHKGSTVVSALQRPAKFGDEIQLHSIRRIYHGFKGEQEWWEYAPLTPTKRARVSIRFPIGREPQELRVSTTSRIRGATASRPATKDLILTVDSPAVGSTYRVDWSW